MFLRSNSTRNEMGRGRGDSRKGGHRGRVDPEGQGKVSDFIPSARKSHLGSAGMFYSL